MRISTTVLGLALAVSCAADAADPLGVAGGLGGNSALSGGLGSAAGGGVGAGNGLGAGLGIGGRGNLGAGLGRAADLGAGGGLGAAGGLQTTGGIGINGNLGATGGLNLLAPGRTETRMGLGARGSLEADVPGVGISVEGQGRGQLRARDRRLMRPDAPTPAGEPQSERPAAGGRGEFNATQSIQARLQMQAESVLQSRLSQIDRMRDEALTAGNVEMLTRADALETQVRTEHRQWVQQNIPRGPEFDRAPVRDASGRVDASAFAQGAADGNAQVRGMAREQQMELRANGLIRAAGQANQAAQFGLNTAGQAVQRADVNYDPAQFSGAAAMQAQQRANAAASGVTPAGYVNGAANGGAAASGAVGDRVGGAQSPALPSAQPVPRNGMDARFFGKAYGQAQAAAATRGEAVTLPGQVPQYQGQFQGSAQGAAGANVEARRFAPLPAVPANGQVDGQGAAQGASSVQATSPAPAE